MSATFDFIHWLHCCVKCKTSYMERRNFLFSIYLMYSTHTIFFFVFFEGYNCIHIQKKYSTLIDKAWNINHSSRHASLPYFYSNEPKLKKSQRKKEKEKEKNDQIKAERPHTLQLPYCCYFFCHCVATQAHFPSIEE